MNRKPVNALLLLSLPTALVLLGIVLLMHWRISTRIQVDLKVSQARLTVDGTESASTRIINSVPFRSIILENFSSIDFVPSKLEVADPTQYDLTEDRFPDSAWKPLMLIDSEVSITKRETPGEPMVTLLSLQPGLKGSETLDPVRLAKGTSVTLKVGDGENQTITIKLGGQNPRALLSINVEDAESKMLGTLYPILASQGSTVTLKVKDTSPQTIGVYLTGKDSSAVFSLNLSIAEPFQLIADHSLMNGTVQPVYQQEESLTYRVELRNDSPFMKIKAPGFLAIEVEILPQEILNLFSKAAIPVTALDFTYQDGSGDWISAVVNAGEIHYPDYPNIEKVSFKAPDFMGLGQLEQFQIKEISLDQTCKGIRFLLDGIAGHIMTRSGAFKKDHRLTMFDTLWQNPRLIILFSVIVWVFPTTLGAHRLYKQVRGG